MASTGHCNVGWQIKRRKIFSQFRLQGVGLRMKQTSRLTAPDGPVDFGRRPPTPELHAKWRLNPKETRTTSLCLNDPGSLSASPPDYPCTNSRAERERERATLVEKSGNSGQQKDVAYLLSDARKNDEEGDKKSTEADVNKNVANVFDGRRPVH